MESTSGMSESEAVMGMSNAASRDDIEVIDEVAVAEVDQSDDVVVTSTAATMDASDDDDDDDEEEEEDGDDDDDDDEDDDSSAEGDEAE